MDRFWQKVDKNPHHCWDWLASCNKDGYGQFKFRGKMRGAHRVAYELLVGDIPSGLTLDHTCKNRACVNPEHLVPMTQAENASRRGPQRPRLICKTKRHLLVGDNVLADRRCRECANEYARKKYHERKSRG